MGSKSYISPLGPIHISSDKGFIVRIKFGKQNTPEIITSVIEECEEQLDAYFAGDLMEFDLPLKLDGTEFQQRVWEVLSSIPYGTVRSYLDVANTLNDPGAVRAVGHANGSNPIAIVIPCHRVIGKNGELTGYAAGVEKKEWLLRHEKAPIASQLSLF